MSQLIELATDAQRSSKIQPPPVNYVSCSCFQPEINPNAHRSKNWTGDQSPLIPGLLDDLAIACLIQVPRIEHMKLRLVCKRWNRLLSENLFYSLRKSHGMAEEWVYIFRKDGGKIVFLAFDPIYHRVQPLPPVPEEFSESLSFGCEVLSGCHLYLFGGNVPRKGSSMKRVIFYCVRKNKWFGAPDMLEERHWERFDTGSCVINNRLYVAGGGKNRTIFNSDIGFAEVYDPIENKWSFISSELSSMQSPSLSFVHNGKWFLKGSGYNNNDVIFVTYSPETNTWSPVTDKMVVGCWKSFIFIPFQRQLYSFTCCHRDRCRLTRYDKATNSWDIFMTRRRNNVCKRYRFVSVVAVVTLNGMLCIIDSNMNISLVDVSSNGPPYYIWGYPSREPFIYNKVVCCRVLEA